jgi:hypothetical protein
MIKSKMNNIVNNLILEFHVPDLEKALEFYSLFGFYELSSDPLPPEGDEQGYLILARDDKSLGRTTLCFYGGKESVANRYYFAKFPASTPRGYAVETSIPVSNIDELWNNISSKMKDEEIYQKLEIKHWGCKDFRVIDPFGFYVRFTELADWGQ